MRWLAVLAACAVLQAETGVVIEVRASERRLVVSHRETAAMPPMVMPLRVRNARELDGLTPGAIIDFELRDGVARHVRARRPSNEIEQDGKRIPIPQPKDKVQPGADVPDFELVDHHGRPFRLSGLRGSVVAVQFIYTRCPMPEVCPRLAATFARLQRRFADRKDLTLLSITLDPRYDTPEVLSRYAAIWRARDEGWLFLSGIESQVRTAAARFGIVYWPEEGVLIHTSAISIIDRSGRMAALVEGLSFTAQQLGDLIEHELSKGASK